MLIVHHLGVSQSDRIAWLCEELGVPYTLKRYTRDATTMMAPPEYKALHPMAMAPVVTDGDLVLAESGAIMEYIIHKYGNGRLTVAPDQPNYPDYLFWFHFANGTLMPTEMVATTPMHLGAAPDHPGLDWVRERARRAYEMMNTRLGQVPYFAGQEFTAADLIMFFPLTVMRAFSPRDLSPYPHIRAFLKRVGARPAYRKAMAEGDPGMELKLD